MLDDKFGPVFLFFFLILLGYLAFILYIDYEDKQGLFRFLRKTSRRSHS